LFYLLELYCHQRNALTDVVVKVPADALPLLFLGVDQPEAIRNQDEGKLECFGKDAKPGAGSLAHLRPRM
jgi:hypothetical protein